MILPRREPMKARGLAGPLLAVLFALPLMHGCGPQMTPEEAARPIEGVEPVESRGADWPVLPREGGEDGYDDPLEDVNQVFFYVNGALDFLFFEPIAEFYRGFMPTDARHAVSRAFTNLAEPVVTANHLLQLQGTRAGTSFGRFLVNSTAGVAGLFDVAAGLGLEADDADFGQTLHHYGIDEGPYLVLPFLGQTTARDAVGLGIDSLLDFRTYLLASTPSLLLKMGEGVVRREEVIDPVNFLRVHAADPYAAVRAWNYQERMRELTGGCTEPRYVICPGFAPE